MVINKEPILATSKVSPWTMDVIRSMDWKRFHELTSLMLARLSFHSEVAWIAPDGTTGLSATRAQRHGKLNALVQCPGWENIQVDTAMVAEFFRAMQHEGVSKGILVSPGAFSVDARQFARSYGIELIDGRDFLGTLLRLDAREQAYYYQMATAGNYTSPTCPGCGQKMALQQNSKPPGGTRLKNLTYKEKEYISDEVRAHKVLIKKSGDVLFQNGLFVENMVVDGRVTANLVCNGLLTISAGACVSGLVAARSIKLAPGGMLEAEARIMNADEITPVATLPSKPIWTCSKSPACTITLKPREGPVNN